VLAQFDQSIVDAAVEFQFWSVFKTNPTLVNDILEMALGGGCVLCGRTHDASIEHHLAAIQIQEMFRKRRAARAVKESKLSTCLPRPFVQQVFRGHRNSRTMVTAVLLLLFLCCV